MSKRVIPLMYWAATLACALHAQEPTPAQPAAEAIAWDLSPPDGARAVLVDVVSTAKGKLTAERTAGPVSLALDAKELSRWIDETAERGQAAALIADRRTYLEHQSSNGGRNQDSGLAGVVTAFRWKGKDLEIALEQPRRALQKQIDRMLRQADAVGLRLPLPRDAEIGRSFPFAPPAFLEMITDFDGELSGIAGSLVLDRVDAATKRAFLSGSITFHEEGEQAGIAFTGRYQATLAIEFDLAARLPATITMNGTMTAGGSVNAKERIVGELEFDARITAKVVPAPNRQAAPRPVFRENTHAFAGLEFKLPSCWILSMEADGEKLQFLDSRVMDPDLVIELLLVAQQVDTGDEQFLKGLTDSLKGQDPKAKVQKAQTAVGTGVAFELRAAENKTIKAQVLPAGKFPLIVRILGDDAAVKKAESEFRKCLGSFKKAAR